MKLSLCSLLILILCSTSGASSNKVGNGGDGVFCKSTNPSEGQLLDFYESKISLQTAETDPQAIAEKRLLALKEIAPKLGEQYLKRLKEMAKQIDYKNDVALTDIKDSKHLFKPLSEDCQVVQVAIRKAKALSNEKLFVIREDLWKQLPPLHQAGLLSHEIIYEHFAKLGEEDSIKARKLNRALYQQELKKAEFWSFVKELEVPIYP